jgi:hypothetical protein
VIVSELESGESLLWAGQPRSGVVLSGADLLMIPFSLMWGGFALFWEAEVIKMKAPLFMKLWGIPFVLMGSFLIFGRFIYDARRRERTFYGLTDRRAIIISGLFQRTTQSLPLRAMSDVALSERSDLSGTITLGPQGPYPAWARGMAWPGMRNVAAPSFELIDNARSVFAQIREAQSKTS